MESEINGVIISSKKSHPNIYNFHEAARRYDSTSIELAIRQNDSNFIQSLNIQSQNALHILLENGMMGHLNESEMNKCVKILIIAKINVNQADCEGRTPLKLAVGHRFSKCVLLLLEAGAECYLKLAKKIAQTMPAVLMKMFDKGVTISDDESLVTLDWRPVIQPPPAVSNIAAFKDTQKESQFLNNLLDVRSEDLQEFLGHPLVEAFIHLKKNKMTSSLRWAYLISMLYPFFYGLFIYFLYFDRCKLESDASSESEDASNATNSMTRCDITVPITIAASLLYVILAVLTAAELYFLWAVKVKYLKNWKNWVLRISIVVMAVTLWPALHVDKGYNIDFQYPIASIGIFLAWVLFLIQVGMYRKFSIYLEMLARILLSVLKIILMFIPLFIGFFMGFNLLFNDMHGVFNFIMMSVDIGSESYDTLIDEAKGNALWFKGIGYTFCVGFIVIIAIVFMNFLLALSVQDVETLKGKGELASLSRIIQNLFVVDLIYQSSALVSKDDADKGIFKLTFNPKDKTSVNSTGLSESIILNITLFLKQKKEQTRKELERNDSKLQYGQDSLELVKKIYELEDKIDVITDKLNLA